MAPNARHGGRQPKPQKSGRTDQRQQKRKRDQEDLQKLEQRVNDLVSRGGVRLRR